MRDGASQRMMVGFYRALFLSVLLYGAESWEYSPAMLLKLESFHNRAIRHLCRTHIRPVSEGSDIWIYPSSTDLLAETKLKSIGEYIYERRHKFRELTEEYSPLLKKCQEWEKDQGKGKHRRKGWWALGMETKGNNPSVD